MDGISPNLQNVSPYETCRPTVLKVSWSLKALHIRETALRITALQHYGLWLEKSNHRVR